MSGFPVPPAPDKLTGHQAMAWTAMARTIALVRALTEADLLVIEGAAAAWARWRVMEDQIAALATSNPLAGEITKGPGGNLQASALRQSASAAFAEFRQLSVALGVDAPPDLASVDLFGNADRPGRGKKGRPSFVVTPRDRNRVMLMLALGWNNTRIADVIDVSLPTFRRAFRVELAERHKMRDRLDARRLELAMDQANAGNISALREAGKLIERQDIAIGGNVPAAAAKPGKKEIAEQEARTPPTDWETILAPQRAN